MKLAGKIALVTGGSRGIGRATALAFAAEGADIAFCHLDDENKAGESQTRIPMNSEYKPSIMAGVMSSFAGR